MQTAVGTTTPLASAPTLCRLENRATRAQAWALHGVLLDQFVASHKAAPQELVLDIDASDIPLHGDQERNQFHGYYDHYCYLPLYVFCGQAMLACYLRNSRIDGAKHAAAVIVTGAAAAAKLAGSAYRRARRFWLCRQRCCAGVNAPMSAM